MNTSELLNIDMKTLGRLIAEGVAWWLEEIREMVPARWRERFLAQPAAVAQVVEGGFAFWRVRESAAQPSRFTPSGNVGRALLLLPPSAVLEREVDLPALSDKDTRRMISLELDRLTPFREDEVYFDISRSKQADGSPRTTLAVLRRSDAEFILANAEAQRIEATAIRVGEFPAGSPPRYDFLPMIRRAKGSGAASGIFWWSAVGVLLVLNLLLLVWRDEVATDSLRATVSAQQGMADLALRVRERANTEALRRRAYLEHREKSLPLPMLEALTKALPPPIWIEHLEWNGQIVRVTGFKGPKQEIQTSPYLVHARVETAPAAAANAPQRFELSAELHQPVSQ